MRVLRSLPAAAVVAIALLAGSTSAASASPTSHLPPISSLDVHRYLGTWYEMASIPQIYQKHCVRDTNATYSLVDATTIHVKNGCTNKDGVASHLIGKAVITDQCTKAQLRVEFFKEPSPVAEPNYVVTYIDDAYTMAVVGTPDRTSGWVLSRTKTLSAEQWNVAKNILSDRGYSFNSFTVTPQTVS